MAVESFFVLVLKHALHAEVRVISKNVDLKWCQCHVTCSTDLTRVRGIGWTAHLLWHRGNCKVIEKLMFAWISSFGSTFNKNLRFS